MKALWRLLTELSSRKFIAKLTGRFASSHWSKPLIPFFIKSYQIKSEEAEKNVDEYRSLNEFFTRRLKTGIRIIDSDPQVLISPVDGTLVAAGKMEMDKPLRIKGQNYDLNELLAGSPRAVNYKQGYYFVLYLSPCDYHRIHAPVTGKIMEKEHITGKVYPVNAFGLQHMKSVLSRNERLISYIQHDLGEIALIKVGAMNVSSIRYIHPKKKEVERGEELAYFEFGSTVVLLTEKGTCNPHPELQLGKQYRMGEGLGWLQKKNNFKNPISP